jgi:hypothetical protein
MQIYSGYIYLYIYIHIQWTCICIYIYYLYICLCLFQNTHTHISICICAVQPSQNLYSIPRISFPQKEMDSTWDFPNKKEPNHTVIRGDSINYSWVKPPILSMAIHIPIVLLVDIAAFPFQQFIIGLQSWFLLSLTIVKTPQVEI